jgi:hypothetical protein
MCLETFLLGTAMGVDYLLRTEIELDIAVVLI